jgi:hypothetical protein
MEGKVVTQAGLAGSERAFSGKVDTGFPQKMRPT